VRGVWIVVNKRILILGGGFAVVQPLRKMLRRTRVLVEIQSIDLAVKRVHIVQRDLAQGFDLTYDQLRLTLGAVPNFHRTPGIEEHALTMKTLGDGIPLRNRLIEALGVADIVEMPTLRSTTMSEPEGLSTAGAQTHESETLEHSESRQ